jgi:hypothetical protein
VIDVDAVVYAVSSLTRRGGRLRPMYKRLMESEIIGRWMVERWYIWQMRMLEARKLQKYGRDRGLQLSPIADKDIRRLWQLALLRADYVESADELHDEGLAEAGSGAHGRRIYADLRQPSQRPKGLVGAAVELENVSRDTRLYFHPFRFYVLHRIFHPNAFFPLRPNIQPISTVLVGVDKYKEAVGLALEQFAEYTSSAAYLREIEHWNDIASLAIATEPCTYRRMFEHERLADLGPKELGISVAEFRALTNDERWERVGEGQERRTEEHRGELARRYRDIGLKRLEEERQQLCLEAEKRYGDKNVLTLLRLAKGRRPLEITGALGGALLLRIMAETIRRQSEDVFGTELPEEDEMGFGDRMRVAKLGSYGTHRLLDGPRGPANAFVRQFGLDYGVRVRWYVEGTTEWGAFGLIFGRHGGTGVELYDLSGRVVSRGRPAFERNLATDLQSRVFSFVTVDGDRSDYVNAIKKAAREDKMCGRFFISKPDFEFANFALMELLHVVWRMAKDNGAIPTEWIKLYDAVIAAEDAVELIDHAKVALPGPLRRLGKGTAWGERLMSFALENPRTYDGRERPMVEAVRAARQGLGANFEWINAHLRLDPETGDLAERADKD